MGKSLVGDKSLVLSGVEILRLCMRGNVIDAEAYH